jgi:hypothetical protein
MQWPPTVADLKVDLKVADTRDDDQLGQVLDAAVAYVARALAGRWNFELDPFSDLDDPPADVLLGTLRLAGRWHSRRLSPDALIAVGESSARIPSMDADIERLLGLGRHRKVSFG